MTTDTLDRAELERIRGQRWFGAKGRALAGGRRLDRAAWRRGAGIELVEIRYVEGDADTYLVVATPAGPDRLDAPGVADALLDLFHGRTLPTEQGGGLVFTPTYVLDDVPPAATRPAAPLAAEQSNTSVRYGDALLLKLFRRLRPGLHPELEIGRFLTERSSFRDTPLLAGSAEYVAPDGERMALGVLQTFVANRGDAWSATLRRLADVLDGGAEAESLAMLGRLGATTGALHVALASVADDPAFAPEPIVDEDVLAWTLAVETEIDDALRTLEAAGLDPSAVGLPPDAERLRRRARGLEALAGLPKTRHHGDYHLGQVLERPDGRFAIVDFEGEPAKPVAVRREKRSPLRDVAGMLRSLDYARHAALSPDGATRPAPRRAARAEAWHASARAAYLDGYLGVVRRERADLLPADDAALQRALAALETEKAAYELLYELNNRPTFVHIPLAALMAAD